MAELWETCLKEKAMKSTWGVTKNVTKNIVGQVIDAVVSSLEEIFLQSEFIFCLDY